MKSHEQARPFQIGCTSKLVRWPLDLDSPHELLLVLYDSTVQPMFKYCMHLESIPQRREFTAPFWLAGLSVIRGIICNGRIRSRMEVSDS